MNERLEIGLDGSALVSNLANMEKSSLMLTPFQHWALHDSLKDAGFWDVDESEFGPRDNVADFFSYEIVVELGGAERGIVWVDEWATQQRLPDALAQTQAIISDLATRVWTEGSPMFE